MIIVCSTRDIPWLGVIVRITDGIFQQREIFRVTLLFVRRYSSTRLYRRKRYFTQSYSQYHSCEICSSTTLKQGWWNQHLLTFLFIFICQFITIYIYITFTKKTRASTNQDPINSSSIIKDPLKDREFFVIDRYQIQRLLLPRFLALL